MKLYAYLHYIIFALAVSIVLTFATSGTALAQGAGLRVQPALVEQNLDLGAVHHDTLRATNLSSETQTYFVVVRNVRSITDTGAPIFAEEGESTGFEVAEWIDIDTSPIELAPNQSIEIPFSIRVPNNATPGAHLGGIYVSTQTDRPEQTGVGIGYQVGPIVNIRVAGDVIEEARIRSFSPSSFVYGSLPITLSTKVDNLGNVTVSPRGPVDIMDFAGKKVATLTMNEVGSAILPEGTRTYEIVWDEPGFYIGRFEAIMSLVYGTSAKQTITRSTSFWVLPPKLVLGVLGAIVVLILGIFIWTRILIGRQGGAARRGRRPLRRKKSAGPLKTAGTLTIVALIGFAALILLF